VTGASGYVGRRVVQALRAAGCAVVALERRRAGGPGHSVVGDIRDPAALERLVADTNGVVHLAAYVHREARSREDVEECTAVNAAGTARLVEAMAATGRKQHLVFVSTAAVYGATFQDASEEQPCRPVTPYGRSKYEAEQIVRRAVEEGSMTATILRPALVCGPGAPGNLARLARAVQLGVCPLVGAGDNTKSLVHVDDLVSVVLACLTDPDLSRGKTYNVAAEPALTMRQIVETLAVSAGRRVRLVWIPRRLAAALTALAQHAGGPIARLGHTADVFAAPVSVATARLRADVPVALRSAVDTLRDAAESVPAAAGVTRS
jgi:nucleoside-diphosphate-sugar epimerase